MRCCCLSKKSVTECIVEFLRTISLGKYSTKLYYNGKASKGSILTGILTILFSLFFVGYVVILFSAIINRENYSLDQNSIDISCLKAIFENDTKSSILTDQKYGNDSSINVKQVEISIAEYLNLVKNNIYFIYSDDV